MLSGPEAVKRERLGWRSDISAGINQDDFFGRFPVGLQEELQQQEVYRSLIQHDLFAALIRIFHRPQQRHDLLRFIFCRRHVELSFRLILSHAPPNRFNPITSELGRYRQFISRLEVFTTNAM
jgi:hypothetical protein